MFGLFKKKSTYAIADLASDIIEVAQTHYPNEAFVFDKKMNTVNPKNGDGPKTYLGNIFNAVKDMSADDRRAYIDEYFESVTRSSDDLTLESVKSFLLTRVRTRSELNLRDLMMSPRSDGDAFFTVSVGDLSFDLTIDNGTTLSVLPKKDLVKTVGSDEEVLDIALQNLKTITDTSPWTNIGPNIWVSKYEDDYDAARIICLFPEYALPEGVENPVVFMPSHNVCLITNTPDPDTLELLVQKGSELAGSARKLSSVFWQNKNAGWYAYKVPKDHPSFAVTQRQELMEEASFYNEQKDQLEDILLKASKDIFVASVSLAKEKDDDIIFSYSVLSFGVDTLLPKAIKVAFFDPETEDFLGMMPWEQFVEIIGQDKFVPYEQHEPIRYHFSGQLDEDDFGKIRSHFSK